MPLKIVAGTHKGRKLSIPKTQDIRPATARVRESVFQILGNLEGMEVLDLFAGTGSVGLEALSRGARHVVFVDSGIPAVKLLLKNLTQIGLLDQAHVLKKSANAAIEILFQKKQQFDLIFLDPPYDRGLIDSTLKKLHQFDLLLPNGEIICEHSPRELPTFLSGLRLVDQRKYGQTYVSFLRKKHEE